MRSRKKSRTSAVTSTPNFIRSHCFLDRCAKDGALTALDILADAMMNSTLPAQEYAKEQEVIRRELRWDDDPIAP